MYNIETLRRDSGSRRVFLKTMAAAGLAVAADRLLSGNSPAYGKHEDRTSPAVPTDGDQQFAAFPGANINIKVLNFALTLEILEADLYRQALNVASGKDVDAPLGDLGSYSLEVSSGGKVDVEEGFEYLRDFTFVEAAHRDFLQTVLGPAAVQANPGGYQFPQPIAGNLRGILQQILPLEETGVRAYLGALPYLTDLEIAATAGGIFSTEARHSAAVRYALFLDPGPAHIDDGFFDMQITTEQPSENTFEYYHPPLTILKILAPMIV